MRVEELLKQCRENKQLDEESLRYTMPEYYVENVKVNTSNNQKIKDMMRQIDRKVVVQFFSGEYELESAEDKSKSSLATVEIDE